MTHNGLALALAVIGVLCLLFGRGGWALICAVLVTTILVSAGGNVAFVLHQAVRFALWVGSGIAGWLGRLAN